MQNDIGEDQVIELDTYGGGLIKLLKAPIQVFFALRNSRNVIFCQPRMRCVLMYDAETIGLVQIEDIKKNNDYAMWLKVCKKANCYLLDENLARYRKRSGSISNHGFMKLIKWHYKLYREAEKKNTVSSAFLTVRK